MHKLGDAAVQEPTGGAISVKLKKPQIQWTEERKKLLTDLYPTKSTREIAEILSKQTGKIVSPTAVGNKAHLMGLKKRVTKDALETKDAAQA